MSNKSEVCSLLNTELCDLRFRLSGVQSISELNYSLANASSFDTFVCVKDRLSFADRKSVCSYLSHLDRDSREVVIRSRGDYIRGECNRGSMCPFVIIFTRRGRIDFVCSQYHKHDHSIKEEVNEEYMDVELRRVEEVLSSLCGEQRELKRKQAVGGDKSDLRSELKHLERKISYRLRRKRELLMRGKARNGSGVTTKGEENNAECC